MALIDGKLIVTSQTGSIGGQLATAELSDNWVQLNDLVDMGPGVSISAYVRVLVKLPSNAAFQLLTGTNIAVQPTATSMTGPVVAEALLVPGYEYELVIGSMNILGPTNRAFGIRISTAQASGEWVAWFGPTGQLQSGHIMDQVGPATATEDL
jgi:hypothetical protein